MEVGWCLPPPSAERYVHIKFLEPAGINLFGKIVFSDIIKIMILNYGDHLELTKYILNPVTHKFIGQRQRVFSTDKTKGRGEDNKKMEKRWSFAATNQRELTGAGKGKKGFSTRDFRKSRALLMPDFRLPATRTVRGRFCVGLKPQSLWSFVAAALEN